MNPKGATGKISLAGLAEWQLAQCVCTMAKACSASGARLGAAAVVRAAGAGVKVRAMAAARQAPPATNQGKPLPRPRCKTLRWCRNAAPASMIKVRIAQAWRCV